MRAVKGNKMLTITESEVTDFVNRGFDIYDGKKLIKHGVGKTVPYAKYEAVLNELEALKAEASKAEEQKAEASKAEEQKAEASKAEEQKAEASKPAAKK